MKQKVICAGHICIDITPVFGNREPVSSLSELMEPGKLVYMNGVNIHTGGSVANTGLAMKLLGNDVRLMGKVGCDAFGHNIRDIFAAYEAGGLIETKDASTSYSVILAAPGIDRIFLHDPGANDTFSGEDIPWKEIEGTTLFHFGYPPLMKKMYEDNGKELSAIFRRLKEMNIATSLDLAAVDPQSPAGSANWEAILKKTLPYVDFFLPSFEELCWMLDRPTHRKLSASCRDITDTLSLSEYAKPLAEKCISMGCGAAVLKCGTSGLYYQTANTERTSAIGSNLQIKTDSWADQAGNQPCFIADFVRSATGSGDLSIAAFLSAVLRGYDPKTCVRFASAEGAASVTSYDALGGLLSLEELTHRIDNGWEMKEVSN